MTHHLSPTSSSVRKKQYGVLSADAVREIFMQRPPRNYDGTFKPSSEASHKLAAAHGVTERSIREVWNCKSWINITRPLWTDAEVAAAFAPFGLSKSAGVVAKKRGVGRPKGSKDRSKPAVSPAASSPTSPAELPTPCLVVDFAKAQEETEFGDPFEEDWLCILNNLELGTMVWFSDLEASALSQDCDASWLGASQETDHIVSSRGSAMEEISRPDADESATLNGFLQSYFGHEVFEQHWQGVVLDVPWH